MPTLSQMVDELAASSQGYAIAPDRTTFLAQAIGASDLSFKVEGDASPGVFEIGDELIRVVRVSAGECVVHPRGRGWSGSTPAAHAEGDTVVDSPSLPRVSAARMVNDQVQALYPMLFGVSFATGIPQEGLLQLPAGEVAEVLEARVFFDEQWRRVRRWETEQLADTPSGLGLRLPEEYNGQEIKVIYAFRPRVLTMGQEWDQTGLSLAVRDAVTLSVLARLAQHYDLGRLSDRFQGAKGDATQPQLGAGFGMARQLKADAQAMIDREVLALRQQFPARAHYVR
ncbi:MAG: hypothetical protein ACRCSN_19710 [Dermatophilaceae bacterium]